LLDVKGVQVWIFSGHEWLVRDSQAPYIEHEERTVRFEPTVVANFEDVLDAAKIVGVSEDPELLVQCESDLRVALGGEATIVRSQPYYLDITSRCANKGDALSNSPGGNRGHRRRQQRCRDVRARRAQHRHGQC
jgi:hydroxymethylpyrimidine pyrophosphatase-like HAD family hydrolase